MTLSACEHAYTMLVVLARDVPDHMSDKEPASLSGGELEREQRIVGGICLALWYMSK